MALLTQDGLDVSVFPPEGCELFLRDFDVLSAIVETVAFAEFLCELLQFAFRTPSEFIVRTITFSPLPINVGISDAHIKGFLLVETKTTCLLLF